MFTETSHIVAHTRSIFSLAWRPGGYLASAGGDGKIIIWKTAVQDGASEGSAAPPLTMRPIAAVRDAHGVHDVNSVNWCLREDDLRQGLLASCGDDGGVKVWRMVADQ